MGQNMEATLQEMEGILRENMELARQSRTITRWGSIAIVLIFMVFGLVLYGRYTSFDFNYLQQEVAAKAPALLMPELNRFQADLAKTLLPRLLEVSSKRLREEAPKIQAELENQTTLLIADLEKSFLERLTANSSDTVRNAITSGVENFQLSEAQQQAVEKFSEESVEYIMIDMQPFFDQQSSKSIAMMNGLYDSFNTLENTKLGQYLWPQDDDEATIAFMKALLELAVIKLDQEEVREMLKTSLNTSIKAPFTE